MNKTKQLRFFLVLIPLVSLFLLFIDYGTVMSDSRNNGFIGAIPASINKTLQEQCIAYANDQGYEAGAYLGAFIIGEDHLDTVHPTHYAADLLLDKTDTVAVFEGIRCVLDSDTHQILGRIPYV